MTKRTVWNENSEPINSFMKNSHSEVKMVFLMDSQRTENEPIVCVCSVYHKRITKWKIVFFETFCLAAFIQFEFNYGKWIPRVLFHFSWNVDSLAGFGIFPNFFEILYHFLVRNNEPWTVNRERFRFALRCTDEIHNINCKSHLNSESLSFCLHSLISNFKTQFDTRHANHV